MGIKYVDFFSLDVEGSEARVLATMDWTIPVRVWCIEWEPKVAPASTNQSIAELMTRNGYERRRWEHEDDGVKPLTPNQPPTAGGHGLGMARWRRNRHES